MKNGFLKKLDNKTDGFLILFLIATVIPLLLISFYNQPSTDDYGCTSEVLNRGFFQTQSYFYHNWSGRYFATALASVNPLVYHSLIGYKLLSALLVVFFVLAVYWVVEQVFTSINRLSKWGITSLFTFLYFLHLPELAEGLYWMSGSLTYQTANIFSVLFIGCIIRFLQSGKNIYVLFSILLSFAAIGSNEVSMLYTDILILLIVLGNYALNKKVNFPLIAVLGACIIFSVFVVTAPGNNIRGSYFPLSHQFLMSFKNTYAFGMPYLFKWTSDNLFIFLLVFTFFLVKPDSEKTTKLWVRPNPFLLLFLCACIPFIGIFPGYWSMGLTPPPRMMNIPYFYFLLGSIYFLYSLSGYLKERFNFSGNKLPSGSRFIVMVAVICMAAIKSNNLKTVYDDIFSGRVISYNEQMEERRQAVNNFNGSICKIKPIENIPKSLYFQDITSDTSDWKNKLFDKYYGKECVLIK